MAVQWKQDSVKELRKRKSRAELQKENEALRNKVSSLEGQIEEQADALIELAALLDKEG